MSSKAEFRGTIVSYSVLQFTKFFPVFLLICNVGSAACYAVAGDYRRAVYWAASALCIAAITF